LHGGSIPSSFLPEEWTRTRSKLSLTTPEKCLMKLDVIRSIWPWLFLLSMSIFFEVWARLAYDTSFLFNLFNIQSILTFAAAPLLLGIGVTFVIIAGGIDLSI
jgi:predicted ABC-type sugar transport system permease subunit